MNDLTAIVGPTPSSAHGECFIWKRDSGSMAVAIDAGGVARVGMHASTHAPEILILSHDDSDHIQGAVALINAAGTSLKELWIPAEWGILIKQIAETNRTNLLPEEPITVNVDDLGERIAIQITEASQDTHDGQEMVVLLRQAMESLVSWGTSSFTSIQGFTIDPPHPFDDQSWYGANDLNRIIKRVKARAVPLINILNAALAQSVRIRYFSIDVALSRTTKEWETAGRPGTVTLANASEAPQWHAVRLPRGLAYSFALTLLSVQNRRALCTLLWSDPTTPNGGIIIWSDSDGDWLNRLPAPGLDPVISTLSASSAPHHASAEATHDSIWAELRKAPKSLIMIRAGGHRSQSYRAEYDALKGQRCCTWCYVKTPANPTGLGRYREVRASSSSTHGMQLHSKCDPIH